MLDLEREDAFKIPGMTEPLVEQLMQFLADLDPEEGQAAEARGPAEPEVEVEVEAEAEAEAVAVAKAEADAAPAPEAEPAPAATEAEPPAGEPVAEG